LLIIVALFIAIVYFTTNTISVEYGKAVQEIMDARVEEAVEEALKEVTITTLPNNTTTTYQNQYDQILIGYVTDVSFNDRGKVNGILIDDFLWTATDGSVQLYFFNTKIDEWDFKQGDLVVAVLVGPVLTSDPAYGAVSRIHILTQPIYYPDN
jgi:hypothetical protein